MVVEKEPVKLNSFPPSLKRSHGGHDSTLPSGSLKLLISFSYSNDFLPFFSPSLPSSLLPFLFLTFPLAHYLEVLVENRGHSLE